MKRIQIALLVTISTLSFNGMLCETSAQDTDLQVYTLDNETELKIRTVLNTRADFDFDENTISDLMEFLKANQVQVVLDVSAEDAGLTVDEIFSLSLQDITIRSALNIILKSFDCTFIVEDEVLKFVSADAAIDQMQTKIYDVSDLSANSDELMDTIQELALPDSWEQNGGTARINSLIVNERGLLLISQDEKGHELIGKLLTGIRSAVKDKGAAVSSTPLVTTEMFVVSENLKTDAVDIVRMIQQTMPDIDWKDEQHHFIKSFGSIVVVKQTSPVAKRIEKELAKVGVFKRNQSGFGGGSFGQASNGGVFSVPSK